MISRNDNRVATLAAPGPGDVGYALTLTAQHWPSSGRKVEWVEGKKLVTGWVLGSLWIVPGFGPGYPIYCSPPVRWRYVR